jgi:F-type H+-transporting ATPase subunit b
MEGAMASETTTGASEHAVGMPQLDISTFSNQIFWLVITLVIIYLVLSKIALPRIASVLSDRQMAISNDLAKAEDLKQAAIDAERAYNLALSEARAEAQTIIEEAKAEIKQELLVATEKADVEISKKAAESEKAISEIRKGAIKAVEEVANDTAQAILGKVMPSLSNEKTIKKAVSDRMKD